MPIQGAGVQVRGLREAKRAIDQIDPTLKRELREVMRAEGRKVADRYGQSISSRSGALAASVRVRARQTGATVGSPLIYAPVVEFGWNGRFSPRKWLMGAMEQTAPEIEASVPGKIQDILDRLFEREGVLDG